MLKLKFDSHLDFQIEAINSVIDIFKGQNKNLNRRTYQNNANILELTKERIYDNLVEIQTKNGLQPSAYEDLNRPYNFTIEMETGTGKTYVYLRTILELNQKYGWSKFIIVVPSVAIKEGVLKNLDITKEHFKQLYENLPYNYFPYRSDNLGRVRMFGQDTNLQIMIITKDSFNKDTNIIHNNNDKMGEKPIEIIKKTKPIVILDEPQKMGGDATQWGLSELDPLFILRYSATHRDIYNLVYKLNPYDAYNLGLVKKIEVLSVTEDEDASKKNLILEKIYSTSNGLRANVKAFVKTAEGTSFKSITLKHGDSLINKTKNTNYFNYIVNEINSELEYISFANGVKIYKGKSSLEVDEIISYMVRETIIEHFEKKKRLNPLGIKVLSLFFLNRVDDYLLEDGIVRRMFKEEFNKLIQNGYKEFTNLDVNRVHSGYFSKMKREKSIEEDESAYDLIMKDKEKLLSLEEPVEFIFSHSALREGWDNPNVFNICTLAYSTSEIKKRQEIGRGLRLPVDQYGNRIFDTNINLLTVITNESYREYLEQLQVEYREEAGIEAPPIEERQKRVKIKLKEEAIGSDNFINLWDRISQKAKYLVNIDENEFIQNCISEIQTIDLNMLKVNVEKIRIDKIKNDDLPISYLKKLSVNREIKEVFNVLTYIEKETNLTKKTIYKILNGSENFDLFFVNPQKYAEKVTEKIKECKKSFEARNIKYINLEDKYETSLFRDEVMSYESYIIKIDKSIYDGIIKDSAIEEKFAKELDKDSRIKLYIKLPEWYVIETPAGNYTPDWAIVVERIYGDQIEDKIFFVVETKGTNNINDLRPEEKIKIESAKKRFELIENTQFIAPVRDYESFEKKM